MPTQHETRAQVELVIRAVLAACDPRALTRAAIKRSSVAGQPAGMIAVGKGASAMLAAGEDTVGRPNEFVIIEPAGTAEPRGLVGDHPLPTERNVHAAAEVLKAVRSWSGQSDHFDSIVLLLSGGASALLTFPEDGVGLADVRAVTRWLLNAGAPIHDLNTVRKHIERLKGGRLASLCAPMPVHVFVLSDVLGDPLDVIGSGPCAPDPTTYADALGVLDRYGAWHIAERLTGFLNAGARGEHPETPKPGDPVFHRVTHHVIGNNETAIRAAAGAIRAGSHGELQIWKGLAGDAAAVGKRVGQFVRGRTPCAVIGGGETTVKVGSASGKGGRNQEMALAAAIEIDSQPGTMVAAFATDGVDGPTDAAGAIVTGETCEQGRALGLDPGAALANHDSFGFFDALTRAGHPHLIRTGPTGTNVNDIVVGLRT